MKTTRETVITYLRQNLAYLQERHYIKRLALLREGVPPGDQRG